MKYLFYFIEFVVWWVGTFFVIKAILTVPDNVFIVAMQGLPFIQTLYCIVGAVVYLAVIKLVSFALEKNVFRGHSRDVSTKKRYVKRTKSESQRYYERHPLKIPSGCRACGGPYPACKLSCKLFDD